MLNKSKLSLAVAGAMVLTVAGMANAVAAEVRGAKAHTAAPVVRDTATSAQRFVVKYKEGTVERRSPAAVNRGLGQAVGRAGLDRRVAALNNQPARPAVSASHMRQMGTAGWNVVRTSRALNAQETASLLRELRADPAVASVEVDQMYVRMPNQMGPAFTPNDPRFLSHQWHFHNATGGVRAPAAWDLPNSRGAGVVVAVLDTGIVENHWDLAANVIPGYDMITDVEVSRRDNAERVPGGWDVGDWVEANYCGGIHGAQDSSWHGSHVAGTVAQETNNELGGAGLAFEAQVMPIRVLGSCGGYGSDIADGITWASGGAVPGMPANENPAQVLNMSLGSRSPSACSAVYQDAINAANARGSIIVVAAGNSNGDAGTYTMSSCQGVISVGATGVTGAKAGYSNWGARIDISAPGGGGGVDGNPNGYIWQVMNAGSTRPEFGDNSWLLGGYTGTSMASPHVAAAVAMVQGALAAAERPLLNWGEMRDLLRETARAFPVNIPANTPMGPGILNVEAALERALEEPCDPEVEECGPVATPVNNRVPVRGLSGTAGSEQLFSFDAQAGRMLSISTFGGTGNVQMYVSFEEEPTAESSHYRSVRPGNSEAVRINGNNTRAGTYYIKLVGAAQYNGVTLEVRQ